MKTTIRIAVLSLIAAGAIAGNTMARTAHAAPFRPSIMPSNAPTPMCNVMLEKCPNIR